MLGGLSMDSQKKENNEKGTRKNNDSSVQGPYIIENQPKTVNYLISETGAQLDMLKIEAKASDNTGLQRTVSSNTNSSFGKTVNALRKLQYETIKVEAEFFKEVHALEAKYEKMYAAYHAKRSKIVSGEYIPTTEESDFSVNEGSDAYENILLSPEYGKTGTIKGIPRFWLTVLRHSEILDDMIEPYDEPILEHLSDITIKVLENPMGFILEFHFSPNEYFSNSILTKQYEMRNVVSETDPFNFEGPEIIKSKGCTIDWKKGRDVTVKTVNKTIKNKQRDSFKTVTKIVNADSFFNFFDPAILSVEECEDDHGKLLVTSDFELGHFIRERIVPRAVLYYTGEALDLSDDLDSEEEMAIEDDEEDEEDEEDAD